MSKKLCYFLFCVLSTSLVLNVNAQSDPGTANLTHSWTFNDGTANDYVGGANGVIEGSAYVDNGRLMLDYSDSWLVLPADTIKINTYDEITIETWFRSIASANTGYHMIVYFGNTVNTVGNDYYFMTPARGDNFSRAAISCGVVTSPWTGESGANGPEYDDGEYHHMVSTLSDTNITLYIDGELTASTSLDTNNSIARISTAYAYLGKSGYDGDAEWMGEILEFNIYNRVLTTEEILFLSQKDPTVTAVGVSSNRTLPEECSLLQNYPNPFNPSTVISFIVPENEFVSLKVYNTLGAEIAELAGREYSAGIHSVTFNASHLASGVYFYTFKAGQYFVSKKMLLQK